MDINIKTSVQDSQLTMDISGRLDALSVKELELVFETEILKNEDIDVVLLDFEEVSYISSAGLRFLLSRYNSMVKKGGTLIVIKPCEAVRDVFSITGFDKIIPIDEGGVQPLTKENHRLYPLRPIQRVIIDDNLKSIRSTMMNMGGVIILDSSTNLEILREAANIVIREHDIFRCRFLFDEESGDIMQRFDGNLHDIDITEIKDDEFDEHMKELVQPFNIIEDRLWRLEIIKTESKKYFISNIYHGIMDGVATVLIFWREIDRYYKAILKGEDPADIRHGNSSYAEYIREEMESFADVNEEFGEYWEKMLEGFSEECFPPRDVNGEPSDNEVEIPLDGIKKEFFSDKPYHDSGFFMGVTLLSMAIVTGQRKAIMTWIHNGRTNGKELRLMGLMLEQLPIRWDFDEDIGAVQYVQAVEELMKEGVLKRKGMGRIYEEKLRVDTPAFIYQKGAIGRRGELKLGDALCIVEPLPQNDDVNACDSAIDIELDAHEDGSYSIVFDYDSGRYSDKAIEKMADIMKTVIEKMQKDCSLFEILGI